MDLAVDEFVRWSSPVAHIARTLTADHELHGCPMKAGSRIVLSFGSANRDEAEFANADEVVVDRRPNRHTAFGVGPHRCVGSHLAKLVVKVALQELLGGLGSFQIPEHGRIVCQRGETRSITNLPVVVGP